MANNNIHIIGIAGPSGAGKTTLSRYLSQLYKEDFEHVRQDDYTKNPETFPMKGKFKNWEVPMNYKFDLIAQHLLDLRMGKEVEGHTFAKDETEPVYTYILQPKKFVILEGTLVLTDEQVSQLCDLKIYLEIPVDMIIQRRISRMKEMGQEHWPEYDEQVTIPEFRKYGEIQKIYADAIVDGTKPKKEVAEEVRNLIHQRFINENKSTNPSYISGLWDQSHSPEYFSGAQ